jgi:hypothetical protein
MYVFHIARKVCRARPEFLGLNKNQHFTQKEKKTTCCTKRAKNPLYFYKMVEMSTLFTICVNIVTY